MKSIKELIMGSAEIYTIFQKLITKNKNILKEYLNIQPGAKILDIGCGPAEIVSLLPKDCEYYGFDMSEKYIQEAKKKYPYPNIHLSAEIVSEKQLDKNLCEYFDFVLATGVIHHLSDKETIDLLNLANKALKKGGTFFAIDPCFVEKQNIIARTLAKNDRGEYVRFAQDLEKIVSSNFNGSSTFVVRNDILRVPYNHTISICRK